MESHVQMFMETPVSPARPTEPLTMTELDSALQNIEQERNPALDEAFSAWYRELKKIAHARLYRSGLSGSMQTTALAHVSYMKLATGPERHFVNRLQFLAYASRTLRSIVIDTIHEARALRRGGDLDLVTLDTGYQQQHRRRSC